MMLTTSNLTQFCLCRPVCVSSEGCQCSASSASVKKAGAVINSLVIAVVLIFAPARVTARDIMPSLDSVQKISESYVVAYRPPEKIVPAQTLQGEELKKLNSLSVADAVRYFSGVQIKDYGGIGGLKTINVRSMGSQHVGVFYDGIQLGNAQNGQIDLGRYSLENMESVTLYNGQKSTFLQSAKDYASASALYLRSRTPYFRSGSKTNLRAKLSGGSFGTVNPSILWEQKLSKSVSNSINAEYLYTTGRYRFSYTKKDGYDTTAVRQNGDVRALRIEEGLFGNIEDGRWRAKLYFYDSERGYPGAFVRQLPGTFTHQDRQWDTDFFGQASIFKTIGQYSINVSVKYAWNYLHYLSDPSLDRTAVYADNRYIQQEAYCSISQELDITERWDVSLAADYQFNTLDADLFNFVYPSRHTALTALSTSLKFKKLKMQGSLLYTHVTDKTRQEGAAAGSKNVLTPTAIAQIIPFDDINLTLRAFYKKIFRMPTLNDLYYTFIGNKYLNPERSTQYNIGASWLKSWPSSLVQRVDASLDCYFNQVKDKIIATPAQNQFQWTMVNLGYVEIRGLDASAGATLELGPTSINLKATYTFQKAQDFTNPDSQWYGGQIPYIPLHSGSATARLTYREWAFNYSFIYTGERYDAVANILENYIQPWYTSDASLSRDITLRKSSFKATLEVNNIFNQQYEVVRCYPMPGTNFKVTLIFEL